MSVIFIQGLDFFFLFMMSEKLTQKYKWWHLEYKHATGRTGTSDSHRTQRTPYALDTITRLVVWWSLHKAGFSNATIVFHVGRKVPSKWRQTKLQLLSWSRSWCSIWIFFAEIVLFLLIKYNFSQSGLSPRSASSWAVNRSWLFTAVIMDAAV